MIHLDALPRPRPILPSLTTALRASSRWRKNEKRFDSSRWTSPWYSLASERRAPKKPRKRLTSHPRCEEQEPQCHAHEGCGSPPTEHPSCGTDVALIPITPTLTNRAIAVPTVATAGCRLIDRRCVCSTRIPGRIDDTSSTEALACSTCVRAFAHIDSRRSRNIGSDDARRARTASVHSGRVWSLLASTFAAIYYTRSGEVVAGTAICCRRWDGRR